MGVINEFTVALKSYLGATYYYRQAPTTATYPYRVGSFNGSYDDENSEVYAFELDYWDDGTDDSVLHDLIDTDTGDGDLAAPSGLNKKRFYLASGTIILERESAVSVNDPDKNIIHIRVSYIARVYRKDIYL